MHAVPSWIISTLKMKVVRRYLPAGLINPSLSLSLLLANKPVHYQPPVSCRTVARSLLTPSEAPSTRRPREAHNFGFIAISLDPFHWWSVNNPVKRRACFPIGRSRYSMDRATPTGFVIAGISLARMTSRWPFILIIMRYASALDNEMSAAVKRDATSCRSRDRAARDQEGSITTRDYKYRRSTAKRGKKKIRWMD